MSRRLYDLLPEIYRTYDAQQGRPLQALLDTLQIQYDAVEANIGALYDGWFVETCPQWAVPYIGALFGVRGLEAASANLPGQRARVGNTQAYRSRKGALAVLAGAAGDAADWPAVVREGLQGLAFSQALADVRLGAGGTPSLRSGATAAWMGTPFSEAARTAAFRPGRGGPLTPGQATLSLFRIQAHPVEGATPAAGPDPKSYRFSPMGVDTPLFTLPQTPTDLFRMRTAAETPLPLTRRRLAEMIGRRRAGNASSPEPFLLRVREAAGWRDVPLASIAVMDLSDWTPPPAEVRYGRAPSAVATIQAGVDPELGRLILAAPADALKVDYAYGFGLEIGGGPYDRAERLTVPARDAWTAIVSSETAPASGAAVYATLEAALADWALAKRPGAIVVADNATYAWPATPLPIGGYALSLEAANGRHPCIEGDLTVEGAGPVRTAVRLGGLWLPGRIAVRGALQLELVDCTVQPGGTAPALDLPDGAAQPAPVLRVRRCIVGALAAPIGADGLVVEDSIVDSGGPLVLAPDASVVARPPGRARTTRTTELGMQPVLAPAGVPGSSEHSPQGVMGHDPAAARPRAPRPVPRAIDAAAFGQPGYARPLPDRRPASDATIGQAGAYYSLSQGQRLKNIEPVADEFLPQGLTLNIDFAE